MICAGVTCVVYFICEKSRTQGMGGSGCLGFERQRGVERVDPTARRTFVRAPRLFPCPELSPLKLSLAVLLLAAHAGP